MQVSVIYITSHLGIEFAKPIWTSAQVFYFIFFFLIKGILLNFGVIRIKKILFIRVNNKSK